VENNISCKVFFKPQNNCYAMSLKNVVCFRYIIVHNMYKDDDDDDMTIILITILNTGL